MRLAGVTHPSELPGPTLVLLHGLGADEHDLLPLASEVDPRVKIVSLRAPYETGYGGFSWFGIQFHPDGSRSIDEAQAIQTCEMLIDDLESLRHNDGLILGGFSQGAMIAAGALMRRPDLVDAAWLMSGRYLSVLDNNVHSPISRPVLVQHGLYDELLPIEDGRTLGAQIRLKGHDVTYREYAEGHGIGYEELVDAREWMANFNE